MTAGPRPCGRASTSRAQASSKTGSGQFCCLGVLCDVVGVDLEGPTGTDAPYEKWGNAPGLAYAPEVLKGLTSYNDRHVLSSMNDEGKSFAEIADYIEQNVPVS